ncbi:MAG: transposase [Bacilli bacterium]|jgi:transposase-like protein|nr:transposase [Bacilli bacterium]
MFTKEEKYAIGKEAYDKVDTVANLARKYGTKYMNVRNWQKAYAKSIGVSTIKLTNYENLTEQGLREELMKKDIEIARLKKGYVVKGGGGKKEYDTTPD